MEDKSKELHSDPKPKNYEEFKNKCWNKGLELVSSEGLKEGYSKLSDVWDEFNRQIPEVFTITDSISKKLGEKLKETGVDADKIDINALMALEDETMQLFMDHRTSTERNTLLQKGVTESEENMENLEKELDHPDFNGSHDEPIFTNMDGIHDDLTKFTNIMVSSPTVSTNGFHTVSSVDELVVKSLSYKNVIQSTLSLCTKIRTNPNHPFMKDPIIRPDIWNIVRLVTHVEGTKFEEMGTKLDEMIGEILDSWHETEGDFLNIDNAPKAMQERLKKVMGVGNNASAPLPNGIIGKPLEELISDHIDPNERTWFMFIYTLRSLFNFDDSEYLTELYEERYEQK